MEHIIQLRVVTRLNIIAVIPRLKVQERDKRKRTKTALTSTERTSNERNATECTVIEWIMAESVAMERNIRQFKPKMKGERERRARRTYENFAEDRWHSKQAHRPTTPNKETNTSTEDTKKSKLMVLGCCAT